MSQPITWEAFLAPFFLSLKVALIAGTIAFVLGVVAAWWMFKRRFSGMTLLETMFMLPLILPPTVVGFILLLSLGRRSWLGQLSEWMFDQSLLFTWGAAVIAATIVSFPLVYQTVKVGFLEIDQDLIDAGRSAGASEWQLFRHIMAPLARQSCIHAYILGFARSLGEFGATLMIAGNIPGKTQTLPTAIYMAVNLGRMDLALYWSIALVLIGMGLLYMLKT